MKLINKREIPKETCYDISVKNTDCFFANGVLVHNSNAGIRVNNGEVVAQSRTRIITTQEDNVGFAKWVEDRNDYFSALGLEDAKIFGEWCGPGIMKGTAINQISNKIFVVFAIVFGNSETGNMIHQPESLELLLLNRPNDIYILPWHGESISVDFSNRNNLLEVAEALNKIVAEVEPCDPWVKSVFGIEGTAEGVVYYPYADKALISRKNFSDLAFKAKGDKHKVIKTKSSVQIDTE